MRPRFSIRRLLILTAVIAAACYWWIARPTIVATCFASTLNRRDYTGASIWCRDETQPSFAERVETGNDEREWYWKATVRPRTWQELWRGQRTVDWEMRGRVVEDEQFEIAVPYPAALASPRGIKHDIRLPSILVEYKRLRRTHPRW
jgi:hypothetical protein